MHKPKVITNPTPSSVLSNNYISVLSFHHFSLSLSHTHTPLSHLQHQVWYKRVGVQIREAEINVCQVGEETLQVVEGFVNHGGVSVTEADGAPLEDQVQVAQRLLLQAVDALKVGRRNHM